MDSGTHFEVAQRRGVRGLGKRAWAQRAPGYGQELRAKIERDSTRRSEGWRAGQRPPLWLRIKRRLPVWLQLRARQLGLAARRS